MDCYVEKEYRNHYLSTLPSVVVYLLASTTKRLQWGIAGIAMGFVDQEQGLKGFAPLTLYPFVVIAYDISSRKPKCGRSTGN